MIHAAKSRLFWVLPLTSVVALVVAAAGSATADGTRQELVKVRIAMNQSASSLPIIVAKRQGFFKKYGIIPIQTITPNITIVPPVLGRDLTSDSLWRPSRSTP